jgi:hypothetical protein
VLPRPRKEGLSFAAKKQEVGLEEDKDNPCASAAKKQEVGLLSGNGLSFCGVKEWGERRLSLSVRRGNRRPSSGEDRCLFFVVVLLLLLEFAI